MKNSAYRQCSGEGQGCCIRCKSLGKFALNWMCFLYEIEGLDGQYCRECRDFLLNEVYNEKK